MVSYENRQPDENINAPEGRPLRAFFGYALAALILVVALVVFMQLAGGVVAKRVPFAVETRIIDSLGIEFGDTAEGQAMRAYLQQLADQLIPHMSLPEGMDIVIHYNDDNVFNAFATIGGNLMFYRGLLAQLPHENALAMVLAHEIAHVLHRDPAAGLGGGVASALVIAALTGNAGTGPAAGVVSNAGLLTGVQFTRRMEVAADAAAVAAVGGLYGHTQGAAALFDVFATARAQAGGVLSLELPEAFERFATTHPLDADRIRAIDETAATLGIPTEGPTTPLPPEFNDWL